MPEASQKSIRAYRRVQKLDAEMRELQVTLAPLEKRALELQDLLREAYDKMELSFHADGFELGAGYKHLKAEGL